MPALNFKAQFAKAVEAGEKCQTVRKHRRDGRAHANVGQRISLYTGQRTAHCRKLGEGIVKRITPVSISDVGVCIGSDLPPCDQRDAFARADGFRNEWEMIQWFKDVHGLPFYGVLIEWELA